MDEGFAAADKKPDELSQRMDAGFTRLDAAEGEVRRDLATLQRRLLTIAAGATLALIGVIIQILLAS